VIENWRGCVGADAKKDHSKEASGGKGEVTSRGEKRKGNHETPPRKKNFFEQDNAKRRPGRTRWQTEPGGTIPELQKEKRIGKTNCLGTGRKEQIHGLQ